MLNAGYSDRRVVSLSPWRICHSLLYSDGHHDRNSTIAEDENHVSLCATPKCAEFQHNGSFYNKNCLGLLML